MLLQQLERHVHRFWVAAFASLLHAAFASGCSGQVVAAGDGGAVPTTAIDARVPWDVGRDGAPRVLEAGTQELVALFGFEFAVPAGVRMDVEDDGINPTFYRTTALEDGHKTGGVLIIIGELYSGGQERVNRLGTRYQAWTTEGPDGDIYRCRFTDVYRNVDVHFDRESWRDQLCESGAWIPPLRQPE
jgi:hypothetical protein